jgi:hypothetical protein
MRKRVSLHIVVIFLATFITSCSESKRQNAALNGTALLHETEQKITDVIIIDIFNPPVSSRIYAYTSLAAYETIRFTDTSCKSITGKLNGFDTMPVPDKTLQYDYPFAAAIAMLMVAEKITFSTDTLMQYREALQQKVKDAGVDETVIKNSQEFAAAIAKTILKRADADNYKKTRAMEKYQLQKKEFYWQPTPPEYNDAIEPNWGYMLPLAMDSAAAFAPPPPLPFSKDSSSLFYKQLKEVYTIGDGHDTSLHHIAWFWDDNPFVTDYSGHLTKSNKKMTPAGHWMAIAGLACKLKNANACTVAKAYSLTAVALYDGFISSWHSKYHYQTIRPITLIHQWINKDWKPLLQTPPFPEYTSGHSVISAAAAEVLTHLFGENFSYTDITELPYDRGQRSFASFREAAQQSSISRVYGGIHYRYSVEEGNKQGANIGQYIVAKMQQ